MSEPILVVGLCGRTPYDDWDALLSARTIVARCQQLAEQAIPPRWTIVHAYDDLFEEAALTGIEATIAEDISRRAKSATIAYLVPCPGWLGDATVSALRESTEVEFAPTVQDRSLPPHVQCADALLLAQAQERAPFDSGLVPIDATVPSVIYNWHGERVIELAGQRLLNTYGIGSLPNPDTSGVMRIPARDPLDGPPSFAALAHITARLRQPDGCPWDRKQTHESMLDDFASEVAEYAEAVRSGDWQHAAEELGDVMLNVLMQAQIGTEADHFTIEDVLTSITSKLVRRHPHVFAGVKASTPEDVLAVWNNVKQQERQSKSTAEDSTS